MSETMAAIAVLTPCVLNMIEIFYRVHYSEERRRKREKNERKKPYVRTLFGAALYPSQVIMPQKDFYLMDNPSGVMTLKSARIAYKAILEQIHIPFSEKVRCMMRQRRIDYGKNLFTVGSRTANQLVEDEFEEWQKRLNLRWTVANPENEDERVCRYSGGELYSRPNFRIYDNEKGDYLRIGTIEKWDEGKGG
jgi:hypothetical protein